MKIGTDFSGIGSPEAALKRLGVEHSIEFACEIDKYARKSYLAVHGEPKTFYEDITKRNHSEPPQLDLYVSGFPCQSFSMAGKRQGFEDTRGTLFFNVAEFIQQNQPKMFILENVKGLVSHDNGKTFQTIVSVLSDNGGTVNGQMSVPYYDDGLGYHIYYKVLNTKNYGIPQNRERIFIVGFKDFTEFRFPKEMELKLRLKDMLQTEVDDKYYLSEKQINMIGNWNANEKPLEKLDEAKTILASDYKIAIGMNVLKVNSATSKGYEEAKEGDSINFSVPSSKTRRGRVGKGVAQTLDTACNQAVILGYTRDSKGKVVKRHEKNHANTLHSSTGSGGNTDQFTKVNERIRRLTPLECWRLQGFTDEQFNQAQKVNSDTQLYKQAGNSITVDVMYYLINKITN